MITRRTALQAVLLAAPLPALAQARRWPQRPIRMVVAFPPGTGPDVMARAIAEAMRSSLGQPVVVENRVGAGGNVGAAVVAHSAPDGYTILWGSNGTNTMNAFIYPSMPFDPERDLAPIALGIVSSMVFAVRKDSEIGTVADLVRFAKERPGTFAVAAVGTTAQVGLEMLRGEAGIDLLAVNFQSSSQGQTALLRGDVHALFDTLTANAGALSAGDIRAIAVTPDRRVPTLPGVPTFVETGYKVDVAPWGAVYAPAGTPPDILESLNHAMNVALRAPEVQQTVSRVGSSAVGGTPEDLLKLERDNRERFGPVIRRMGMTPQ